ncbi:cupin domain-containing protein [Siculibacillus lacustris]|uniref:Cupin domain-containing protein n=1 Tax=Siculibacillus lacustris TaxID=1549641 RepID=A0A4Q9VTE7_9HYPH|nr:cupin domain-containing protein [Siculibacillus lacustris]TBW38236.1 cupin domain-containing protein [Siculibacillus lacustris]
MNKLLIFALVAGTLGWAGAVQAEQLFLKDTLKTWDREKAGGGEGTLAGKFSFTRNDTKKEEAIKEIGWMTLKPGASVGLHKHDANEDAYIIISGEGIFTDTAGKESPVKAGDITIARKGESHALKNAGSEPLVFLDVIAAQQ